jgi:hypothetical protein
MYVFVLALNQTFCFIPPHRPPPPFVSPSVLLSERVVMHLLSYMYFCLHKTDLTRHNLRRDYDTINNTIGSTHTGGDPIRR